MEKFKLNKENIYEIDELKKHNIYAYFSTNNDGISKEDFTSLNLSFTVGDKEESVIENRNIYANKVNKSLDNFVFVNQNHTTNIKKITKENMNTNVYSIENKLVYIDAIYTFENDIVLNTFHADCTPIYLISTKHNLICVLHAGWKGTVDDILEKSILHFKKEYNINPSDMTIYIGPSINKENFDVKQDVIDLIDLDKYNSCIEKTNSTNYKLDVKKMNYIQAKNQEITNIFVSDIDTYDSDNLFSFRKNNITGRMCATIYQTNK